MEQREGGVTIALWDRFCFRPDVLLLRGTRKESCACGTSRKACWFAYISMDTYWFPHDDRLQTEMNLRFPRSQLNCFTTRYALTPLAKCSRRPSAHLTVKLPSYGTAGIVRKNVPSWESQVVETYRVTEVCCLSHAAEQADLNDPSQHLDRF